MKDETKSTRLLADVTPEASTVEVLEQGLLFTIAVADNALLTRFPHSKQ